MPFQDRNPHVLRLNPNNFTPLSRTPWAGNKIAQRYKESSLSIEGKEHPPSIGESWEFSCDPEFPSICIEVGQKLSDLAERYCSILLPPNTPGIELLLKILDTGADLSLQVHPEDRDANLKPNECGKPESWLILDHEEGAGIYLGFKESYSKEEIQKALESGIDMRSYLQFVPVQKNDYFDLKPGVPHAIGKGVTLLEPQRILFGKSGKTFRMYDWGRKYDKDGRLDPVSGSARSLHVAESMRLIDPQTQWGERFVASLRVKANILKPKAGVEVQEFAKNPYYKTYRIGVEKNVQLNIQVTGSYGLSTVLSGQLAIENQSGEWKSFAKGSPAFWPYNLGPLRLKTENDRADFIVLIPEAGRLNF